MKIRSVRGILIYSAGHGLNMSIYSVKNSLSGGMAKKYKFYMCVYVMINLLHGVSFVRFISRYST